MVGLTRMSPDDFLNQAYLSSKGTLFIITGYNKNANRLAVQFINKSKEIMTIDFSKFKKWFDKGNYIKLAEVTNMTRTLYD